MLFKLIPINNYLINLHSILSPVRQYYRAGPWRSGLCGVRSLEPPAYCWPREFRSQWPSGPFYSALTRYHSWPAPPCRHLLAEAGGRDSPPYLTIAALTKSVTCTPSCQNCVLYSWSTQNLQLRVDSYSSCSKTT